MGCTPSLPARVAPCLHDLVEQAVQKETRNPKDTIKILLLGEGESGKSTIAKQMRILHSTGYSEHDLQNFKSLVHVNTIEGLASIIRAMETLEIDFDEKCNLDHSKIFLQEIETSLTNQHLSPSLGRLMKILWSDKGVQKSYTRSNEYQLIDSAGYYLNRLDKITSPSYVPDEQDVLRTRIRTVGIVETQFFFKNLNFRLIDVGGQRTLRKKWIHCFDNVDAMIFCASLSGYDLVLEEDKHTNRMLESLQLFRAMYNLKWFLNTAIILLLNKRDIFQMKIQYRPLTICFPDYDGDNTYKDTAAFIKYKFEQIKNAKEDGAPCDNQNTRKVIYTHFTCATDTPSIADVFDAISDIAIQNSFSDLGLC